VSALTADYRRLASAWPSPAIFACHNLILCGMYASVWAKLCLVRTASYLEHCCSCWTHGRLVWVGERAAYAQGKGITTASWWWRVGVRAACLSFSLVATGRLHYLCFACTRPSACPAALLILTTPLSPRTWAPLYNMGRVHFIPTAHKCNSLFRSFCLHLQPRASDIGLILVIFSIDMATTWFHTVNSLTVLIASPCIVRRQRQSRLSPALPHSCYLVSLPKTMARAAVRRKGGGRRLLRGVGHGWGRRHGRDNTFHQNAVKDVAASMNSIHTASIPDLRPLRLARQTSEPTGDSQAQALPRAGSARPTLYLCLLAPRLNFRAPLNTWTAGEHRHT